MPPARALHLLDLGTKQYGDSLVYRAGDESVLIDGGHRGDQELIDRQLAELVSRRKPRRVTLLVVSHAHEDHIGALPALVRDGLLEAEWALVADPGYGWGRGASDAAGTADAAAAEVRGVVAALREEPRSPSISDEAMRRFIEDAATLEDTYRAMLDALRDSGTKVVRHGRDSAAALLRRFRGIGLDVIGPTRAHLEAASERVAGGTRDAVAAADALLRGDAVGDPVRLVRRAAAAQAQLRTDAADALADALADAQQRLGAAVNCQSTVISLSAGRYRMLLGGDMQFAASGSGDEVDDHVRRLRRRIQQRGPFGLVKLSHHGSDNGYDARFYEETGSPRYVAITTGNAPGHHPHPDVLDDLRTRAGITWARTDRNGRVRFSFRASGVAITKQRGTLNDARPPEPDMAPPAIVGPSGGPVEVVTRAPFGARVTVVVEPPRTVGGPPRDRPPALALPRLDLFGGRTPPRVLFVTSRDALATNIGISEATHVLDSLRARGAILYDALPRGVTASQAEPLVRTELARHADVRGMVLLGGYDVVPSQRLDCLPPDLRDRVERAEDNRDGFIVWSDDLYVDTDDDDIAELPISRIPDGHSPELVYAQLQAKNVVRSGTRSAIRNRERPFADNVLKGVAGTGAMLVSGPALHGRPDHRVDGDVVYLMLHGSDEDASQFWGGEPAYLYPVVLPANVPNTCGMVVFTGCCWGALTVERPAGLVGGDESIAIRVPERSLALRFLQGGVTAFIGCTGAHYSPDPPGRYHGGAMHHAFWRHYQPGGSPAEALHRAKLDFAREIPHGLDDPLLVAIDVKIHRQFTCLGLGW